MPAELDPGNFYASGTRNREGNGGMREIEYFGLCQYAFINLYSGLFHTIRQFMVGSY